MRKQSSVTEIKQNLNADLILPPLGKASREGVLHKHASWPSFADYESKTPGKQRPSAAKKESAVTFEEINNDMQRKINVMQ